MPRLAHPTTAPLTISTTIPLVSVNVLTTTLLIQGPDCALNVRMDVNPAQPQG